jgi:hypothetical protein
MADDKPTTNLFAGPPGAMPQQPVELEFETPPQAFEYPERPEHPNLHRLLWLADPRSGTREHERIAAFGDLMSIYQQQVGELRRGQRRQIDFPLIRQFTEWSLRALVGAKPVDAAKFLFGPRRRGKRARPAIADRDFQIAVQVASKMMLEGATLERATAEVAESRKLSRERVETIYKTHRKAARATVALQIEAAAPGSNHSLIYTKG